MNMTPTGVMVPAGDYPVVHENESINRAADILVSSFRNKDGTWRGYESLLVKNDYNEIVGLFTLRSLLKALGLNDQDSINSLTGLFLIKSKNVSLQVRNFMRSLDNRIINIADDLNQVVDVIINNQVNSVVVVDCDKIVGVIRAIDLLWFVDEMI
ncbi:CBS domain-containing protein [Desulfotomaculum arcticum]|uniref:CBS domain-containing protein n=1 Tax=Desulfotruncus arcticus DSM 17038 TaxID=1121424 RepID=A0A1I2U1J8_9FIRM|nr:CBS domain-containing protein [Desulfotruncus arcticus]SFG70299.1 CBS domain-containing protein [Desulfotomaculum arcticum] [Desulfotruncus arcticus DSM 17038]